MDRRMFLRRAGVGALGLTALEPLAALAREPAAEPAVAPLAGTRSWTWGRIGRAWTAERCAKYFDDIAAAGIGAVLLRGTYDDETLALAKARDIAVHAWTWTLCRPGSLREEHPEWFAVNREGVSTAEKPPYVSYYRFLCPFREEVGDHLVEQYAKLAAQDGLDGIHLDYVRYPDVILPKALWARYDLVQDEELPPFDYCYCEVCREGFRKAAGVDPLKLPDPSSNEAWRQFRYDNVTRLVGRIAEVVRAGGRRISAAVFPTPAIARRLVRQDWSRWDLDAVFPMIYHRYYEEPVAWIETAVREGVAALAGRVPLHAGLYSPMLETDDALREGVRLAYRGGASGVALFGGVRVLTVPQAPKGPPSSEPSEAPGR